MKKEALKKNHRKQDQQQGIQVKKNRYAELVGLAIIILLGINIYSNSFDCSFHFDDYSNIVHNTKIQHLQDVKAWWNFYPTRSVGMFTFALNYHFNKLDVTYYHRVNLIIHLINAFLVWWLTMLIFSSPVLKDNPVTRQTKVIAFFSALLFVSHPLATQSVTYIWQRFASLVTMFYLLSLIFYIKARLSDKGNILKFLLFTGSLIAAMLAMLTKENAFTLPFAIVLVEIFFLRIKKFSINFRDFRLILLLAAFLGVILIIPLKVSFSIFATIPPRFGHIYTVTPINYLFTQFSVIVNYIQLLILPINQHFDYDFPISNNFFEVRTILCFLVIVSLILVAIFLFKKHRVISFGIFWFFLTLSVESGIIPLDDLIYEHRTYLPSFGFFLIFSTAIYGLSGKRFRIPALVMMVIMVIFNSYLTYERNKVWKDDLTLWNDNVAKAPNIARPIVSRGYAYASIGQWDKAIADYTRGIGINPNYAAAYTYRGVAYDNLKQWYKAIADYSRAIGIDPAYTVVYYNRGVAFSNLGQWAKAIADYSRALEIDPQSANVYYNRGVAYGNLEQWDKAIDDYSKAIRLNPDLTQAISNRELAYRKLQSERESGHQLKW